MGRSKKPKRAAQNRHDPILGGGGDVDAPHEDHIASAVAANGSNGVSLTAAGAASSQLAQPTSVPPIVKKLSSETAGDRSWAAAAIANLVLEDGTRLELLKSGVVPALVAALGRGAADERAEVLLELAGAVRNLASFGGSDVCLELVRRGMVGVLLALWPKVRDLAARVVGNVPPASEDEAAEVKAMLGAAEQVILSLWSLAEVSNAAVESITSADVFS
ncbi:hypothetical protein HK405_015758, partial [Cladochytrium tenue]